LTKRSPAKISRLPGGQPRLAFFCSGYGSNFQAILDTIRAGGLKAAAALMVCDNPKAYALRRARKYDVPVVLLRPRLFKTREDYERVIARILKNEKVDLVILAGFMRILSPFFVRAFRNRILNIHPSLLPAFKGAHAIQDALAAGVPETGVTVHYVTDDLDAGPIILQEKVRILKTDTVKTLETRIHQVEHRLYPLAINKCLASSRGRG
jgi:phosphoribosylglycinamide formyltransferase-1